MPRISRFTAAALSLVSFTAFAADPVVQSVTTLVGGTDNARTVSVTFTFSDADGDACYIALFGHDAVTLAHYPMRTFAEGDIYSRTFTPGTHTVTWLASQDREPGGPALSSSNFKAYVQVCDTGRIAPGRFCIVDVSGGSTATSYPVEYKSFVDVSLDVYKTDKIVLRELPDGSWAGVYEITQRQYERVTGATPSSFSGNPNRPVEMVSWNNITGSGSYGSGIIKQLRDKAGLATLDLPSSAAWEYACRAGTTYDFGDYTQNRGKGASDIVGNDSATLGRLGWYRSNSGSATHDAGGKQPNAWGLYDMHGNVGEWCSTQLGGESVIRGGGWIAYAGSCGSGDVYNDVPYWSSYGYGFRLAVHGVSSPPAVAFDQGESAITTLIVALGEDIDGSGSVDAVDIQLVINAVLGLSVFYEVDINQDGKVDAIDIQLVINAALGIFTGGGATPVTGGNVVRIGEGDTPQNMIFAAPAGTQNFGLPIYLYRSSVNPDPCADASSAPSTLTFHITYDPAVLQATQGSVESANLFAWYGKSSIVNLVAPGDLVVVIAGTLKAPACGVNPAKTRAITTIDNQRNSGATGASENPFHMTDIVFNVIGTTGQSSDLAITTLAMANPDAGAFADAVGQPGYFTVGVTAPLIGSLTGFLEDGTSHAPIGDAVVVASFQGLAGERVAVVDLNGEYSFSDLPAGSYTVQVFAPGYGEQSKTVNVSGSGVYFADFRLTARTAGQAITGVVRDKVTGKPLGGIRVDAKVGGVLVSSTYTTASGRYELVKFSGKTTMVTIEFSGHGYTTEAQQVELPPDQVLPVDGALIPKVAMSGSLMGCIRDVSTQAFVVGARVTATMMAVCRPADTGPGGAYLIPGLEAGSYSVRVSKPDYVAETRMTTVSAGATVTADFAIRTLVLFPEDTNRDGKMDAVDIQLVINAALGLCSGIRYDCNRDGRTDAIDVQRVINGALGLLSEGG